MNDTMSRINYKEQQIISAAPIRSGYPVVFSILMLTYVVDL